MSVYTDVYNYDRVLSANYQMFECFLSCVVLNSQCKQTGIGTNLDRVLGLKCDKYKAYHSKIWILEKS